MALSGGDGTKQAAQALSPPPPAATPAPRPPPTTLPQSEGTSHASFSVTARAGKQACRGLYSITEFSWAVGHEDKSALKIDETFFQGI